MNGCLHDFKLNKHLFVNDIRRLQEAASAFIIEGCDRWLVEYAQIMRWMQESPLVNSRQFYFWLMFRFLGSPVTVLKRLLQK
jgi:hypothetical protein